MTKPSPYPERSVPAVIGSMLTRRQALKGAGFTLLGTSLPSALRAQESAGEAATAPTEAPTPVYTPLNRYPRSVQDYYVREVMAVEQAANARRAALKTKADAERYVADVRARFQEVLGPFPAKTPLNARVTARHEREGYHIENVIFESRPGFLVTANLYVPTDRPHPLPGVVGCCGHSASGKGGGTYQMFAQGLARQGYLTLLFDPMGQGERFQFVTDELKPKYGLGTHEHTYSGVRMVLTGDYLPRWFVWDGIRAIDYLLSRPEVDPQRIGVTGNSGGGTQATWLCAVDRRITMAAPSCFVTTLRRNITNEHAQDPEQFPWNMLALGLDHSDAIAAMAPKPVMILGKEKDYFDARGFEEAAERLRHLYGLLGVPENFASFLGEGYHGFSQDNREAMYGWFNRAIGVTKPFTEPSGMSREKPETLRCTPAGQVAPLGAANEFAFIGERSRKLREERPALEGAALRQAIIDVLKLPDRSTAPDYQILRRSPPRGYPLRTYATYVVASEPGVAVVTTRLSETPLLSRIPRGLRRAVLYVSHESADAELREDAWVREFCNADSDTAIFACDPRGRGDSRPEISTPEIRARGGVDYFHAGCALMLGKPMVGRRTHDVLSVLDLLRDTGHEEIHLVASGWGAIPATFAAVLHDSVRRVTLRHALTSFADVAETETYRWPLSVLPPEVLKVFDLPDCYRELATRKLTQVEPVAAAGVPA